MVETKSEVVMAEGNMKRSVEDSVTPGALVGRFERKLGRDKLLTIPAMWMACLGKCRFVYAMPDSRERCLNILPAPLVDGEMTRLCSSLPNDKEMAKALQAIGKASERLELDSRHRIRISDKLLDFAGIGNRVLLLGRAHSIKIWDSDTLEKHDRD